MQNEKDTYDEGQDIDKDSLMQLTENKYKTLVNEEKWNALTMEQKQIISLTTELKGLKENWLQLGNKRKNNKSEGAENQFNKGKENSNPNVNSSKKKNSK